MSRPALCLNRYLPAMTITNKTLVHVTMPCLKRFYNSNAALYVVTPFSATLFPIKNFCADVGKIYGLCDLISFYASCCTRLLWVFVIPIEEEGISLLKTTWIWNSTGIQLVFLLCVFEIFSNPTIIMNLKF